MNKSKESRYLAAFGKRVGDVRRHKGITQEQLAEKSGLTPLTIGFVEQGRRWPRIITLHKIADALGVQVEELFKELRG